MLLTGVRGLPLLFMLGDSPHRQGPRQHHHLLPSRLPSGPRIKQHTSRESCWFVRDGRVYDPTKFLDAHPGGPGAILSNAGEMRGKLWRQGSAPAASTAGTGRKFA